MPSALYLTPILRTLEATHADQPLMQRAGAAAADWALEIASERPGRMLVLAGPGNNGGDAYVAALELQRRGIEICLVAASTEQALPPDASTARQRFRDAGLAIHTEIPANERWSLVVDGLFGIGLSRAPAEPYAGWITAANALDCPILSLDCPSGLDADTGRAFSPCVRATHTLTFLGQKPGLLTADGPDLCGYVRVTTLGLDLATAPEPDGQEIGIDDFAHRLRARRLNTHKGSFGGAGILGGGKSMVGAALLAARAALKLGAGRVYLGLIDPDPLAVDPIQPELMVRRADNLLNAELQALGCGPGLGKSGDAIRFVEQAIKCPLPLVLDADALNIVASDGRLEGNLYNRVGPAILTPHPAEAARLLGSSVREVQNDRMSAAREIARRFGCHVALKGVGTIVVTVDGRWRVNTTGNPGMATAGMGDVLTGIIVSLLAQGWPEDAALLCAVHLHGAAADQLVREGIGPIGLTAGETIDAARRLFNQWIREGQSA